MRIDFVGHACVVLHARSGVRLLLDPWLHEPVFAGRWYRYPPQNLDSVPRAPAVLALSHAHPDHSGVHTLEQLSPERVLMCRFPTRHLQRRLRKHFSHRLVELEPWRTTEVAGARWTAVPNDLGWEDASFVVEVDGVRVYHGNDNPLLPETYRRVRRELGEIDVALLPFAGASSYPTCFDWPPDAIAAAALAKKNEALDRFREGVRALAPKWAVPSASHWALLDPGFIDRNWTDRYTVNEATEHAAREFPQTRTLAVAPGDAWNPDEGHSWGSAHDRWPQTREAVREYAQLLHPVLRRQDEAPSAADLAQFTRQLQDLAKQVTLPAGTRVCIVAGSGVAWCLLGREAEPTALSLEREGPPPCQETVHLLDADLTRLARGQCRWEDLWYGYALRVAKRPGTPYYRAFWEALLEYEAPGFEAMGE